MACQIAARMTMLKKGAGMQWRHLVYSDLPTFRRYFDFCGWKWHFTLPCLRLNIIFSVLKIKVWTPCVWTKDVTWRTLTESLSLTHLHSQWHWHWLTVTAPTRSRSQSAVDRGSVAVSAFFPTSVSLWFRMPRTRSCMFLSRTLSRVPFTFFNAITHTVSTVP